MTNTIKKKVKKIVIPAAGWGTRFLPLTKVVHKELVPVLDKPIIHYLVKEAAEAGVEEVILVISPRKLDILKYFTTNTVLESELRAKKKIQLLKTIQETNKMIKISIAIQNEQLGLGHAIFMAADIVGDEPFGVILGDDLIDSKVPAIKQLIDAYDKTQSSILGVQNVSLEETSKYGIVKPKMDLKNKNLFEISAAVEKPSPKDAPSTKAILGRYILTPEIFTILRKIRTSKSKEVNVIDAFDVLFKTQKIYALEFVGTRYDLGSMEGFIKANIDYSLKDKIVGKSIKQYILKKQ